MASSSPAPAPADALRRNRILSSKLYLEVPTSKAPVVYSPDYDIAFLGIEELHPFDSSKWGRVCKFLTNEGYLAKSRVVEPLEASKEDLLVVHSEAYLNSFRSSFKVASIVEVPPVALLPNWIVQRKLLYPFWKQVGGSILSAKLALERGWAINVGGGFHHCSAGEEVDFVRRVYTLDMYNAGIYSFSGTKTDEYLEQLDKALEVCKSRFQRQLIVYDAGTDILDGDPLGRLTISSEGVAIRDEKVFRFAKDQNIPLLMLTSGGYMKSSARVISDSIINLVNRNLIQLGSHLG